MLHFEPLDRRHDRKGFCCGVPALDAYLLRTARQHATKGLSRTFVCIDSRQSMQIQGYFTLTVAEIDWQLLPDSEQQRLPKSNLPLIKLARLALDEAFQGRGMGGVLLFEAMKRAQAAQTLAGACALVVEAKDARAAAFYEHFGFVAAPDDEQTLFMSFKVIQQLLESV